ncbi:MAG: sugar phosphate nucleotidyltransferase [candidate division KSB1 bacterium]|nr:sugar phosphate nucleotidyltransferase [candidate division KSB1 bacterium]
MKAMILAAGYGTRLKPLTDNQPKALIAIEGYPLLQLTIQKMLAAGVTEIVINAHHFAEQIVAFIDEHRSFGIRIDVLKEKEILGTGGGLKNAQHFFDDGQPFILHNVDILSTINLQKLYQYHCQHDSLATLAVQQRSSTRYLIMDEHHLICGHEDLENQRLRLKRPPQGQSFRVAFCGIHVISPAIFDHMLPSDRFSIIDVYLNVMEKQLPVLGYPVDQNIWMDIGKIAALKEVQQQLNDGTLSISQLIN